MAVQLLFFCIALMLVLHRPNSVRAQLCTALYAALVRNYFSGKITFSLLSHAAVFDQINVDVLSRRVNYLYLATFTCPTVFLYPV